MKPRRWGAKATLKQLALAWLVALALALVFVQVAGMPVSSYFCNLADQAGGGIVNQVGCGIYRGTRNQDLPIVVATAMAIATGATIIVLALRQRKHGPDAT